jgi:uncharacterized protein (TIGR03083 family)
MTMSRPQATKDFWMPALRTEGAAFYAAIDEAAPEMPVPSCPDWTVTNLVHHLGSLYRWVGAILSAPEGPPPRPSTEGLPTGRAAVEWWQREYEQLVSLLDKVDADAPAWNWAPQPKRAAFWHRRMTMETAVHRWDAQMAIASGEPIEAAVAVDGVSEVLDTWLPAGRGHTSHTRQGVVHLQAVDVGQEWFVRLRGSGVALLDTGTILDTDDHHPTAQAAGTASDLLLALYGRVRFDVLDIAGDPTLLDALRTG